mmetsp:Transcript_96092/g.132189  ORF Transcript_96092/g.132189 Transcript_96092/m.132189 type:complete len:112 (+) Transcript_96092:1662-1997(+)
MYCHLHEMKIIHGDIKAANILYDGKRVKLSDFGDSRFMDQFVPCLSDASHSGLDFKELHGSILFMAPEVIQGLPYGTRSDIWALGCTLIEIATAQAPWPHVKDINELFMNL